MELLGPRSSEAAGLPCFFQPWFKIIVVMFVKVMPPEVLIVYSRINTILSSDYYLHIK